MLRLEAIRAEQEGFALTADWRAGAGERIAVIGPSGAGKSTLLGAIAGFVPLTAGRIRWNGEDIGALPPGRRPLSILFQDNNLFPHLDVTANLGLGLRPDLRLSRVERARVAEALARVGLEGFGGRMPGTLSGGEQGRVALGRALLRARPMLLLDEPFAALGPGLKAGMIGLVEAVAAETGALVLMVTHEPADARRFADLTVLVAGGIASEPVSTATLFADPPPALRDYLGD